MMELDELKAKWEAHDQQLEKSLRLNRELLSATKLKRAESELRWLTIYSGLEAGMWLVIVVALGTFVADHIHVPGLAWSGIAVDVMSIGMLIALIRRMIGTLVIDYSQSIAAIQKQVEAVRMLRIRTTQWAVLCGTLLWVPWLAVVSQAFFRRGYLPERGRGLGDRQRAVRACSISGGDLAVKEIRRPDTAVSVFPAFDERPRRKEPDRGPGFSRDTQRIRERLGEAKWAARSVVMSCHLYS
jgi:hypothetical protein